MRFKFNRIERVAGLFVLLSMTGTVIAGLGIVIKKGLFEPKVVFHTTTVSSNSIRPGTPVHMAGLRAGSVNAIELGSTGQVKVEFVIFKKYVERIRTDSRLHLIRPSLIGERVLEITMGNERAAKLPPDSLIPMIEEEDAMDLLSGKRLAILLGHVDSISLEVLDLLKQVSAGKNVQRTLADLRVTVDELKKSVKSEDLTSLLASVNHMTNEMGKVAATLNDSSINIPESARKIDDLLAETTIMVQGMQRNWFFRGGVKEAKEAKEAREEAQLKAKSQRMPAAQPSALPAPLPMESSHELK